jgi:hypothetical protein
MSQLLTQVTNTITTSATTFEGYAYNSFAFFQGNYYGAGDAGLFQLDAAASTETITGTLTTGKLHFGSEMQKRCSDFFIAMHSEDNIDLTVTVDEVQIGEYVINPYNVDTIRQRRVAIGKGLKGKYWEFSLACPAAFDYDSMNIAAVPVSRRL